MTPGQINYEAYRRERIATVPTIPFTNWNELPAVQQHAWETAAHCVAADVRIQIRAEQQIEQQKAAGA